MFWADFLDRVYPWVTFFLFLVFCLFVFSLLLFVLSVFIKRLKRSIFEKAIFGGFFVLVSIVFLSPVFTQYVMLEAVENISASDSAVVVFDGKKLPPKDKDTFFKAFSNIYSVKRGGSYPKSGFEVSVESSEGRLVFDFKIDSRDESVYWVFCSSHNCLTKVGMIKVDDF